MLSAKMVVAILVGLAALAVIFAPVIWAGYRLYTKWSIFSIARRISTVVAGLVGTVAIAIGVLVVMSFLPSGPYHTTDVSDYSTTIKYHRFPEHVRHFPDEVEPSRVISFEELEYSAPFPDLSSKLRLHTQLTTEEADRAYARALEEAQYIIAWEDSAGTERSVDVRRGYSTQDLPASADQIAIPQREPAMDYIGYVLDAQRYRRETENADSQIGYAYGIAFHKHRKEAIYWAYEWTF